MRLKFWVTPHVLQCTAKDRKNKKDRMNGLFTKRTWEPRPLGGDLYFSFSHSQLIQKNNPSIYLLGLNILVNVAGQEAHCVLVIKLDG